MSFKSTDKIWIYTASKELNIEEQAIIMTHAQKFLNGWESHGAKVLGDISVKYDRFIIVTADDCGGSMCGRAQDSQVHLMKSIEKELNITLLDRMLIPFKIANGKVEVLKLSEFQTALQEEKLNENTLVFDNTITTVGQFNSQWEVAVKDSWHRQLV